MADLYIAVPRRNVDAFVRRKLESEIRRLEELQITQSERDAFPRVQLVFDALVQLRELLSLMEAIDSDVAEYERQARRTDREI